MSFTGFPKGLGFAFSKMAGFSKQIDIVYPDRKDSVTAGSRIRVKMNNNTHMGLRTLNMYYNFTVPNRGTCAVNNFVQSRFHPRLSSSIIQSIAIYFNNNLIDITDEYNLLYNTLYDLNSGDDQIAKRFLEGSDASRRFTENYAIANTSTHTVRNTNLTTANAAGNGDYSDTDRPFVINNFMNFLGNSSCEYLDTNDVGDFELVITLAPATICFHSGNDAANANAAPTPLTYTLNNIYFTYERIILEDPLYYQIKESRLMSPEGLEIEYTSYESHIGPLQDRSINYSFNTNASSLDTIICTTRRSDYNTETFLQLDGFNAGATANINFPVKLNTGIDCFNQSMYFRRDLSSLTTSQITINGTQMYKSPLSPVEIWNENLLALNAQGDLNHAVHPGCNSLPAFLKYYFAHILSLNYNKETKEPLISGLDGKGSSFNILWKTTNNTTQIAAGAAQVIPIVFCAKSNVVRINAGKQISIMP